MRLADIFISYTRKSRGKKAGPVRSLKADGYSAWPDRQIWLDARCSTKKGWAWEWTYDGRLLGSVDPPNVIKALEATLDPLQQMDNSRTHELSKPWIRLLAKGPQPVR